MIAYRELEKEDRAHIHNVILHALQYIPSEEYIEDVWDNVPEDFKLMAEYYGFNGTVFRDNFCEWLLKVKNTL